jgi:hypothetical protein
MLTDPHMPPDGGVRVDKSSAGHKGSAHSKLGFGMTPPSPTYDGITYVTESERISKTPKPPTPDGGCC